MNVEASKVEVGFLPPVNEIAEEVCAIWVLPIQRHFSIPLLEQDWISGRTMPLIWVW